jgi:phage host-nuclease inhibitor protein Gam
MSRIKITSPIIQSRAAMEELVGEIAALTIEQRKLSAEMDRQLQAIREKYDVHLGELKKLVEEKTTVAQAWAEANPEEFKGKRKSIEFMHGTVGFRTGTPKLAKLKKWTWKMVLAALKLNTWGLGYVRTKEEIDKEAILAAYRQKVLTTEDVTAVGVAVIQEESFFVEPKLTEVETRSVA